MQKYLLCVMSLSCCFGITYAMDPDDPMNWTDLHMAATQGNVEAAQQFIQEHEEYINERNAAGDNALDLACRYYYTNPQQYEPVIQLLYKHEADASSARLLENKSHKEKQGAIYLRGLMQKKKCQKSLSKRLSNK